MTRDQINQLKEILEDGLSRAEIPEEAIGLMVTGPRKNDLLRNLLHVVKEFAKIVMGFTTERLKVDRSRTPQEAIDTLKGVEQEVEAEVLATMPGGNISLGVVHRTKRDDADYSLAQTVVVQSPSGGEGDVFCLFQMEHEATDEEIWEEYRLRGLRPADGYEVCRINEGKSDFTYKYPNVTIWQVGDAWHFIACYAHLGKFYVRVKAHVKKQWNKGFWFVGVPLT